MSEDNSAYLAESNPRQTPCPCRLKPSLIAGFGVVVPLLATVPYTTWWNDRAAFSMQLFEVFLKDNIFRWFFVFSAFIPVFVYWKSGFKVLFMPLIAFALYQTLMFFHAYGFVPIPAEWAAALKFWPQCVGAKCSFAQMIEDIRFEYNRPGEQQLIEDAAWCAVTSVVIILVETRRWSIRLPGGVPTWVLAALVPVLGYDLIMPIFVHYLWQAEVSGKPPKKSTDLRYFYLIAAIIALVIWWPFFLNVSWEIVTGRFYKVPVNPFGQRAFWSVYGFAFALAFYFVSDVNPVTSKGACSFIPLWILRILFVWFMCSSIVGSWLVLWYFREQTPNRSFKIAVDIPSVNGNNNPYEDTIEKQE